MSVPSHADVIVLKHRPGSALRPGDLMPERRPLRAPGPGEVVVRNIVTTGCSNEVTTVAMGEPIPANSVGIVVQSEDPGVPVGTQVATYTGWQAYATTTIAPTEIADPALGSPLEWISVLGTTGITAYVGIHDIGQVRAGNTVLVSAATGAVGGVAVQLAKAAGARVVAIAGGRDRTDHALQVLSADVAVDYRDPAFLEHLQRAAGEGVDVFFDNVGGRQLTLALSVLNNHGSVVLCGSISSYARPDDPDACVDLRAAVFKRVTLRGFIVSDFYPQRLVPIRADLAALRPISAGASCGSRKDSPWRGRSARRRSFLNQFPPSRRGGTHRGISRHDDHPRPGWNTRPRQTARGSWRSRDTCCGCGRCLARVARWACGEPRTPPGCRRSWRRCRCLPG